MQIEYDSKTYEFDFEEIDVLQAKAIKAATHMTIKGWEEALKEADPDAIQALWWLILVQNGHNPKSDPASVNAKIVPLARAFSAAQKADEAPAPDPTDTPRSKRSAGKTS
jgi:hypothetical protein